jgi:arylsulfatase A
MIFALISQLSLYLFVIITILVFQNQNYAIAFAFEQSNFNVSDFNVTNSNVTNSNVTDSDNTSTSFVQPNFILIVADDLGINDLSVYGSRTIYTPNIDKLANSGIRFTQFYTTGPLCTPSRGSMFTGKYPIEVGMYTHLDYPYDDLLRVFYPSSVGHLSLNYTIIPEYLKHSSANYSTAMIGKWHLGHTVLPTDRGFDYFYGLPYSHEEGYPGPFPENLAWPPVPLFFNKTIIKQPFDQNILTNDYTQQALSLLNTWKNTKQPFFLHIAYEQPHIPLFASTNTSLRGLYGDAVQDMDTSIGTIFDKLTELNLDDNTVIIFLSDNGAWINPSAGLPNSPTSPLDGGCNAPFYDGKGSTWEGGVGVPAILWTKQINKSLVKNQGISYGVATVMDILPTILDLANISITDTNIRGHSLVPRLLGNDTSPYTFVYFWRENVLYAIRYLGFKAHYYTRPGFGNDEPTKHDPPLLFNVEWNPSENIELDPKKYANILEIIDKEYKKINREIVKGIPQYGKQSWKVIPCCNNEFNKTQFDELIVDHELDLALWYKLGCVCM